MEQKILKNYKTKGGLFYSNSRIKRFFKKKVLILVTSGIATILEKSAKSRKEKKKGKKNKYNKLLINLVP